MEKLKIGRKMHVIRNKFGEKIEVEMNKNLAIKLMCTECMGFESDPAGCTSVFCPLFPYRKKTLLSKQAK